MKNYGLDLDFIEAMRSARERKNRTIKYINIRDDKDNEHIKINWLKHLWNLIRRRR